MARGLDLTQVKTMIGKLLGSIRLEAEKEFRKHRRTNAELIKHKRPAVLWYLNRFLFQKSIFLYLFIYTAIVLLALLDEFLLKLLFPKLELSDFDHFSKIGDFLTVQITALGLIFPIAVGLVTVIIQRNEVSSTSSDIQVYYYESMAYQIGASSISLLIALLVNLFVLNFPFWEHVEIKVQSASLPFLLPIIHLWWIVLNFVALWFFLKISLSFVQPKQRENIRKLYAANVAIPSEIKDALVKAYYHNCRQSLELGNADGKVTFALGLGDGEIEVRALLKHEHILVDVWKKPLIWVLKRWLERTGFDPEEDHNWGNSRNHSLDFPLMPTRYYSGEVVICRRTGDLTLTRLERQIIKMCFRFKMVKE